MLRRPNDLQSSSLVPLSLVPSSLPLLWKEKSKGGVNQRWQQSRASAGGRQPRNHNDERGTHPTRTHVLN